jgi:hypothetical protein
VGKTTRRQGGKGVINLGKTRRDGNRRVGPWVVGVVPDAKIRQVAPQGHDVGLRLAARVPCVNGRVLCARGGKEVARW